MNVCFSSKVRYQLRGVCTDDFDTQFTIVNKTHLIGNLDSVMMYKDGTWNIVDKTDLRGVSKKLNNQNNHISIVNLKTPF